MVDYMFETTPYLGLVNFIVLVSERHNGDEIYEAFVENLKDKTTHSPTTYSRGKRSLTAQYFLYEIFIWNRTKQGYDYWDNLYYYLQHKTNVIDTEEKNGCIIKVIPMKYRTIKNIKRIATVVKILEDMYGCN